MAGVQGPGKPFLYFCDRLSESAAIVRDADGGGSCTSGLARFCDACSWRGDTAVQLLSQRDALQAQLRDVEAKAEQAQKNNELTAIQREALQAQLKAAEEKAQQAQKNGELTASQRDAL